MSVIAHERFISLIQNGGLPSERFAEFIEELTRQANESATLSGTGSPEGVVTANPKRLYMDDSGASGSILYIKKTGSGNTGWILV